MPDNKTKKTLDRKRFHQRVFTICLVFTLLLFTGGAFTPPMFVLDKSLLYAAGILMAFATIAELPYLVEVGKSATIKVGDKFEVGVGDNGQPHGEYPDFQNDMNENFEGHGGCC